MSRLFSICVVSLGFMLIPAMSAWAQKDKRALPPILEIQTAIKRDPMNPTLDVRNTTAQLGTELALSALGMKIL